LAAKVGAATEAFIRDQKKECSGCGRLHNGLLRIGTMMTGTNGG